MTLYRVTLDDGSKFLMEADLVQASAPISANFHDPNEDGNWQGTPFQTADARHDKHQAAKIVNDYFRGGPDDYSEVEKVVQIDDQSE
jgi:hypothetical protein